MDLSRLQNKTLGAFNFKTPLQREYLDRILDLEEPSDAKSLVFKLRPMIDFLIQINLNFLQLNFISVLLSHNDLVNLIGFR